MERELEENIKLKTAISLNILLQKIKSRQAPKADAAFSYGTIASRAFIRKATVSNIFNAKTNPGTPTLILIIEAMGFTIIDFAEIYESFSAFDLKGLEAKLNRIKN
ncbi:hypothetical protein ACW6QP_09615 [Salegentibacter sp. HM20]